MYGVTQHVQESTRVLGGFLDIVITGDDCQPPDIKVDEWPRGQVCLTTASYGGGSIYVCRQYQSTRIVNVALWHNFDLASFRTALRSVWSDHLRQSFWRQSAGTDVRTTTLSRRSFGRPKSDAVSVAKLTLGTTATAVRPNVEQGNSILTTSAGSLTIHGQSGSSRSRLTGECGGVMAIRRRHSMSRQS